MTLLKNKSVLKVREALVDAGFDDTVIELDKTALSVEDAAKSIGVDPGAMVRSLVFKIGARFVMALVAGDHRCKEEALPRALNLEGEVATPNAKEVRGATGFAIGGVPPIGHESSLPMVLDVSLKRFDTLYAVVGHKRCVFPTTVAELKKMTGAIVSYNIAEPLHKTSPEEDRTTLPENDKK